MVPGDVIAERFEIERSAGSGGMGTVFRARDRRTGVPVAVKVMHGRSSDAAARFTREAGLLSELSHPAIVGYVGHGTTPAGSLYLAMDWIDGQDLASRIHRGPLSIEEAVAVVGRAAEGLGFAHDRGVIHRDVKPSNLLLAGEGMDRVRVVDFGIARTAQASTLLTQTGTTVGTPAYMAPEQARGEAGLDARADVFALGCVLFECLAGVPAFDGEHGLAILAKILFQEAPSLSDLRPGVPRSLEELVRRMLAKNKAARPADGGAVARAIQAIARSSSLPPRSLRAPSSLTGIEQRVVSIVVAQDAPPILPGRCTGVQDPDRTRAVQAEATRFGAQLEHLVDGSVVAIRAGDGVATDQAATAARFALALRKLLPDATIVLTTGRAVLSGKGPVGEAIERAAAILRAVPREREDIGGEAGQAGKPGGTLRGVRPLRIDEVTAGLLDVRFDVRGDSQMLRLCGQREVLDGPRTLLGKPTPCVGRERELARLVQSFDECVGESSARAVLVKGSAGIGKSRIRHELLRRLQQRGSPFEAWIGQGETGRTASPFGVIAPALRRSAGILDGEPPDARRTKLRARVARSVRGSDLRRVTEFVGELVGVGFPDDDSPQLRAARRDPILMGDQVRRAWEEFLAAECREQPLVLVIEDLHWSDPPSVKLIGAALSALREQPFLVIALARPEVQEAFPRLWEGCEVDEFRLGALGARAADELIAGSLGALTAPALRASIIDRAGGNPFYIEELIRAAAAGGTGTAPATVLAMVQARLETLGAGARRALRAASVFGDVFWLGGLQALLGGDERMDDVRARLGELIESEIVSRRGEGKFPGEDEFAFRHSLVREAAYAMLTDADRALGHGLAGAFLELSGEEDAAVIAGHFERGDDPARGRGWYRRAAVHALAANDFDAAVDRARRGISCGASGELRGALELIQGEALHWSGRTAEAEGCCSKAMVLLARGSVGWCKAAGLVATILGQRASHEAVEGVADELVARTADPPALPMQIIALARTAVALLFGGRYARVGLLMEAIDVLAAQVSVPDPMMQARVDQARGARALYDGDLDAAVRLHRSTVVACDEAGDLRAACAQRANLGDILRQLGCYREAEDVLRLCLGAATRMGLHGVVAGTKHSLGMVVAARGANDLAITLEREAMEMCRVHGLPRTEGAARARLAWALMISGDLVAAAEHASAAADLLTVAPPLRAEALAIGAQVSLARGRTQEALETACEAMRVLSSLGQIEEGEAEVRLSFADALWASGNHEGARQAIVTARDRLLARAARIADPVLRGSFLAISDSARTLERVREWCEPT